MQFVFVGWRPDRLAIGRINREQTQMADGRCNYPCLRIDYFITKRWTDIAHLTLRENRDTVVRFLALIR